MKLFNLVQLGETESERMHRFLSQARDRYHLEYLEREWDNRHTGRSF